MDWDNLQRIAEAAGFRRKTIHKWKSRGRVPYRHHYTLVMQANAMGLILTFPELNNQ